MTAPQGAPKNETGAPPLSTIPLQGYVNETGVELVPRDHYNVTIGTALVGMLGSIVLGIGLSPMLLPSVSVDRDSVQTLAKACVDKIDRCEALTLTASTGGTAHLLCVVGIVLVIAYVVLQLRRRRSTGSGPSGRGASR